MRVLVFTVALGLAGCGGAAPGEPRVDRSAGGQAGSGGSGTSLAEATGGRPPTECGGTVTIRVSFGGAQPARYCPSSPPCQPQSTLRILDSSGASLGDPGPGCGNGIVDCANCRALVCTLLCVVPPVLPEAGDEVTWQGFIWEAGQACANGSACSNLTCAPPGPYIARYCAYPVALDAGLADDGSDDCMEASMTPVCVEQPFDYPTTTLVEMVLEQP